MPGRRILDRGRTHAKINSKPCSARSYALRLNERAPGAEVVSIGTLAPGAVAQT